MTISRFPPLNNDRCWICGYRKLEQEIKNLPYPLCAWCFSHEESGERLTPEELIKHIVLETEEYLKSESLVRCEDIDELSFMADIGDLGARHPYLKQFTSMIGLIAVQIALEKKYTLKKLLEIAQGPTPERRWQRVYECITFLLDVGLLERGEGKHFQERFRPSNILLDLAPSIEAVSKVDKELPPRISNCIAGYALLRGIKASIEGLKGSGKDLIGILKLYPKSDDGGIWIPKRFTATTMFLVGHLAHGYNEFSENDIRVWLSSREITWGDATWIINWLNRTIPSAHRLVDPRFDGITYHFLVNQKYTRMRERYRERRRNRF